jgi:hypothetical protein
MKKFQNTLYIGSVLPQILKEGYSEMATTKTTKAAKEVKETAAKKATKEAAKAVTATATVKEEVKAPAKKETKAKTTKTTKKAAEKKETKAPAKKTTTKKTPSKKVPSTKATKTTKAVETAVDVYVEFHGKQVSLADVVNNVKLVNGSDAKNITIYLKPEEDKAYFVADGEEKEMDVFFC